MGVSPEMQPYQPETAPSHRRAGPILHVLQPIHESTKEVISLSIRQTFNFGNKPRKVFQQEQNPKNCRKLGFEEQN